MRVAIPLFGTRVAPRCFYSNRALLAQITDNRVVSRKIVETTGMSEEERLSHLVDLGIEVFVCGAIEKEFVEMATSYGIKVVRDVAAEAEEILLGSGHSNATGKQAADLLKKIESARYGGRNQDASTKADLFSETKQLVRSLLR